MKSSTPLRPRIIHLPDCGGRLGFISYSRVVVLRALASQGASGHKNCAPAGSALWGRLGVSCGSQTFEDYLMQLGGLLSLATSIYTYRVFLSYILETSVCSQGYLQEYCLS